MIHTVGPNWNRGEREAADLARCFSSSLAEAVRVGARSLAFPAISAGIFGWAPETVADIAVTTVRDATELAQIDLVRFVLLGDPLLSLFQDAVATAS